MIIKNKGCILELDVPMYKDTHFSTLYLRGNELIKVYDDSKAPSYERISERVFNNLTSINSEAFLNLRKCYSAKVQLMEEYPEEVVTAYTYDYIKSIDNKMIDMPMDYTIETLYRFRELVELLNLRRIEIRDAHAKNVVRTENGLVIIDPDRYISSPEAYHNNLRKINEYIIDLWGDEFGLEEENLQRDDIKNLFFNDDVDAYIDVMKSRLNEKTPRDLIEKTLRKRNK